MDNSKKQMSRQRKGKNHQDPGLILRPSYTGQPTFACKVDADPIVLSTTVTTGLIANTTTLTNALISNFATRFALWDEYRVIKVEAIVRLFSTSNPGQLNMWFDIPTTAGAAPALADSRKNRAQRFSASAVMQTRRLAFTPTDPTLQLWEPLATGLTIGVFKLFTNNADYGASTVATQYCEVTFRMTLQFRGYA
jgi:hypothetical protein